MKVHLIRVYAFGLVNNLVFKGLVCFFAVFEMSFRLFVSVSFIGYCVGIGRCFD